MYCDLIYEITPPTWARRRRDGLWIPRILTLALRLPTLGDGYTSRLGGHEFSGLYIPSLSQLPRGEIVHVIEFGAVLNTPRAWISDKQLPAVDMV